jgi:hypothetical protein
VPGSQDDATWNEIIIFKCKKKEKKSEKKKKKKNKKFFFSLNFPFAVPANSQHAWAVDIDVWNEGIIEFWSEGQVSLNEYLGSTRIDDAADPTAAVRRTGVRSVRRSLSFRLALPTPQVGELAPVQCGEILLEIHYARADELVDADSSLASSGFVDSPAGSALSSPRVAPSAAVQQQQQLLNQQQLQLAASLASPSASSLSASTAAASSAPHRKMTLTTVSLFRTCGLCNEVCWGVALQAYMCGDCHAVFHRRCQQAAALQTACTPLEKNRGSKIKVKQLDLYDAAKKRKRLDKCMQEIAAEPHISVDHMLEFMTWVASAYDQFNSEAVFAILHAKPVSAGVMPAVVESLASRDIFARLVVIQVLQQLLYLESNKVALIAKGGIPLLLQSLRDLQMYFLNSVSLTAANSGGNSGNSSGATGGNAANAANNSGGSSRRQ